MRSERWVVLGLAHSRAAWFGRLSQWSTAAAVPVDFVKCVSADEVRARITGGQAISALLVGGDVPSLDRDLVETVRTTGAAVIVIDPVSPRDWEELGVAAVLPHSFDRNELLATLAEHASPIARAIPFSPAPRPERDPGWRGRLVAVTGTGGTSIVAMSIAQAFGTEPSNAAMVVLADLALDAEQGMLHDAREVLPGVQELVEAHGSGRPSSDDVRSLVFDAPERGYHLLLGLRRHRDWTAIRPHAFAASLDGLLRSYRIVVADIDTDLEDEALTGSLDVEDRNTMARTTAAEADVVVVVGTGTTKGLHALSRTIRSLRGAGVAPSRILPVCNRAPRSPRRRSAQVAALAALLSDDGPETVGNPVFLPERSDIETAIRDGVPIPTPFGRPIHREIARLLDVLPERRDRTNETRPDQPEPVVPGSLGSWTEEAG